MLSNQIGEEAGQVTGTRVLPDEGAGPKIEMSIQENGTLLGVSVNAIYFQTTGEKLAQLNGIAVVFELEIGEDGKTASKFYEWT